MNVSIVIPIYKPNEETLKKIFESLKKQKFKDKIELIKVNKGMGLAEGLNYGIRKSKYPIVLSLHQDCIPSDENWLQKLVEPFKEKEVVLTVSKVYFPEELWDSMGLFTRALMIRERGTISPSFDEKGCAYRKEVLLEIGLFNDKDFLTGGEDADMDMRLKGKGKVVGADCTVIHRHPADFKARLKKIKLSANSAGTLIRKYGLKKGEWSLALIYSIPLLGMFFQAINFPFKKELSFYPFYFLTLPLNHYEQVIGFWKGFIKGKQTLRSY